MSGTPSRYLANNHLAHLDGVIIARTVQFQIIPHSLAAVPPVL